jgi:hypothetical protein
LSYRRCVLAIALFLSLVTLAVSAPALAAECAGDECQGPPPAPAEVVPGTAIVEGPQNPSVHFPKPHHPKKPRHKNPGAKKHPKPPSHRRGVQ